MKKLVLIIIPVLICGLEFTSCSKDNPDDENEDDENEIEGIYVGTYTTTNLYRGFSWTATPIIELKKGKYTYKELSDGAYYTSGSGNYSIKENKIIFELISYPIPIEKIGVIEELLLIGEYDYVFDGKKLSFSKVVFPITSEEEYSCEFELTKK